MDLSIPGSDFQSPSITSLTPVFGDNVQDLLGVVTLHVNPSSIFTVNSIADVVDDSDGVTTLREAINWANAIAGEDSIVFDESLFAFEQTITLSLGQLSITDSLSITAPLDAITGANLLTVSGNNASRVFEIVTEATVTLTGLIVANGSVRDDVGGGIKNSGTLTLDNSIVRNNTATADLNKISYGGGIYNSGTLTVNNSTLSGNRAVSSLSWDGISSYSTDLSSRGGGIYNSGTLSVSNSTLTNNSAVGSATRFFNSPFGPGPVFVTLIGSGFGGGIYNSGTLTLSNSNLTNNSAVAETLYSSVVAGLWYLFSGSSFGSGIYNDGTLTVSDSTLSGNSARSAGGSNGGGIYNKGIVMVNNSTLSGNSAGYGGGIYNDAGGTVTVNNSTLSGNRAEAPGFKYGPYGNGGGISNSGSLTLVFTTLTLNQAVNGGGMFTTNSGSTRVRNTISAGNLLLRSSGTSSVSPDVAGNFTSDGYNLIGDSTGSTGFGIIGDIVGTSDNPIDPRLASLDFNGGPTKTFALLPDSPAINAAGPVLRGDDPTTDGRGFPRVSNGRADIGAFEFSFS